MRYILPVLVFLFMFTAARAEDTPHFAVASNMMQVMTEILKQYKNDSGTGDINLVFGSSGNFTRQIIQGAPFELFLSANKKYVEALLRDGMHVAAYREFAHGHIGYFIPTGSKLSGKKNLEEINNSLINGDYRRIAIANPEFAPYGVAARQVLQAAGLWVMEKKKLLLGENIAQAMQYTLAGGVDIGIVPQSFAVLPQIRDQGKFFLIPEDWHEPIIEYLVLLQAARPQSRTFYQYLLSGKPKPILEKYGYSTDTTASD